MSLSITSIEPTDKQATETTFIEMSAFEVPPPIEVDAAEHTTTGHVFVETTQSEASGSELIITTSILQVMTEIF